MVMHSYGDALSDLMVMRQVISLSAQANTCNLKSAPLTLYGIYISADLFTSLLIGHGNNLPEYVCNVGVIPGQTQLHWVYTFCVCVELKIISRVGQNRIYMHRNYTTVCLVTSLP